MMIMIMKRGYGNDNNDGNEKISNNEGEDENNDNVKDEAQDSPDAMEIIRL